jgi:hypothetical protein
MIVAAIFLCPSRVQEDEVCHKSRVVVLLRYLAIGQRVALSVQVRLELPTLFVVDVLLFDLSYLEVMPGFVELLVEGCPE